jgi:hypothetical protein
MNAISIPQPWASAVVFGAVNFLVVHEDQLLSRGPVLIHAASEFDVDAMASHEIMNELKSLDALRYAHIIGKIIGSARLRSSPDHTKTMGLWGRGWLSNHKKKAAIDNARVFIPPVPYECNNVRFAIWTPRVEIAKIYSKQPRAARAHLNKT